MEPEFLLFPPLPTWGCPRGKSPSGIFCFHFVFPALSSSQSVGSAQGGASSQLTVVGAPWVESGIRSQDVVLRYGCESQDLPCSSGIIGIISQGHNVFQSSCPAFDRTRPIGRLCYNLGSHPQAALPHFLI